jgi:hypothetical protein
MTDRHPMPNDLRSLRVNYVGASNFCIKNFCRSARLDEPHRSKKLDFFAIGLALKWPTQISGGGLLRYLCLRVFCKIPEAQF